MTELSIARAEQSHIFEREENDHYVENFWCSERLFEVERFAGTVQDPFCGFGRVVESGRKAGLAIFGTDLVDRGYADMTSTKDFLTQTTRVENIVGNPPFNIFEQVTRHALSLTDGKVALIWLTRRLAAARWLETVPLARIHYLTPRPSMPPGFLAREYELAGKNPKGGKQDFCWLVFDHSNRGPATTHWLHRDKDKPTAADAA